MHALNLKIVERQSNAFQQIMYIPLLLNILSSSSNSPLPLRDTSMSCLKSHFELFKSHIKTGILLAAVRDHDPAGSCRHLSDSFSARPRELSSFVNYNGVKRRNGTVITSGITVIPRRRDMNSLLHSVNTRRHSCERDTGGAWRSSGGTNKQLVKNLRMNKIIKSDDVFNAMSKVDRGHYVTPNPYSDSPQSIGFGATISAPHMHAFALEYLRDNLQPSCRVLDVGGLQ
eukprot:GHVQ01035937.1.p1 GENE.GHVQ01035937.1~~GHVQ01035937.1.p1  ORF type:complete len:229 (+),score=20.76 GHVQ01035937.1:200-886(+)